MDLQFQQMFQRKPNRPQYQQGTNQPNQGQNRTSYMQRPPHIQPPVQMQQNQPFRGGQNFNQNPRPNQRNFRQQGQFQQNQGNFNQTGHRNQNFRNQHQNPYQGSNQFQDSQNPPPRFRQPKSFQNRQQSYQGPQYNQRQTSPNEQDQRRSQPNDRQPYNKNQSQNQWIPPPPPQRNPRNPRNDYKNANDQDQMRTAMNQFFQQNFQSHQPRGRGRGRGNRGRPNNYQRGENQHQKPFKSEMDKDQNKQRFDKFRPQPIKTKEQPKRNFIKRDEESESHEISIESERSYSDEYSDEDEGSRSESYSGNQEKRSESQMEGEDEGEYSDEGGQEGESPASQEALQSEEESGQEINATQKLPSIKSMNDIATNAINDMCSREEFAQRLSTFQQNNRDAEQSKLKLDTSRSFSIFEINRRTLKPDYLLALKRFKRSAERAEGQHEDDTKDCRRSVKALVKVMNHINKEIIDADNMRTKDLAFPLPPGEQAFEFIHIYDFLWDRMREMIKDITRLSLKQKLTKQIITICQQIARFFILSINQGRKKYNSRLKFDQRMNIESIIKVISNLMQVYRESRMNLKSLIQGLSSAERQNITMEKIQGLMNLHGIYISPHQPQLSAYSFLFSDDRKKEFYRILTTGFEDPQTQSESPLINSDQMQTALAFHRTLNQRNIQKFFDQIQNPHTDYVFSCLMLKHLQMIRKQTSKMLFKSHYYKDDKAQTAQKSTILAETLRQTLRFPNSQQQEFVDFLGMLGVRTQGKLLIWRDGAIDEDHYIIPEYIYQHDKTERKNWSDEACKKNIFEPKKLSREELIKCSWKNSTYRQQIINFFLGKALEAKLAKPIKPKITISKEIPNKEISKQSIELTKEKEKQPDGGETQIQKQAKQANSLSTLNQMRKEIQKKLKRSKFVQKMELQVFQLFRHTDQAKIINRKKALAVMDEWLMYYHDKMLSLAFNTIDNEARKKNLLVNVLRQIKTYSVINKHFHDSFNRLPYEFEPQNQKNIVVQRAQKGLMSGILSRAHSKAKKVSHDSFEDYLNKSNHSLSNKTLNFMILTTCSSSTHNEKILYDLMLYFIHQQKGNFLHKKKLLIEALNKNKTKEKQVPLIKVHFQGHNLTLNLRLAKINEAKSKRKAIAENSHVIQHLFGCHSLILMRDNSKHVATQVILQNLEDFVSSRSRIYQTEEKEEEKQKIETLQLIELPILLVNTIKRPSGPQANKGLTLSKISRQKYPYLINLKEAIVIEGTTEPCSLPFMLRQQIQKQLKNTQDYTLTMNLINAGTHHFNPLFDRNQIMRKAMVQEFGANLQVKPLRQLLREIRVNSSVIEQKMKFKEGDMCGQVKKKFIFSFYQEYFNLCMEQIASQASKCFKNSIFFKQWTKHLLSTQNILTQKDFLKTDLQEGSLQKMSQNEEQDLISHTLDSEPQYNIITETFKEYEFIANICQDLRMKFVGEHIEPLDTKYLIFDEDGFNVFGMPKKSAKDQIPRDQKDKILHLTHFINSIGKYLNLFDSNKTINDEKFQNLYTIFHEYQLHFKLFNLNNINGDSVEQNTKKKQLLINYQIEGDSLEFFSYLIGYLMDGCKHVNVLLPANFRFKISMEQFMQQGMRNLKNVINMLKLKKKDIFENLRNEKVQSLSKLVLDSFYTENGCTSSEIREGNNVRDIKYNRLGYREQKEDDYMIENDEESVIDVDRSQQGEDEVKVSSFKRQLNYHYKTVYSDMKQAIQNPRRRLLNELKKKIKVL